jgi:hypothetical protein
VGVVRVGLVARTIEPLAALGIGRQLSVCAGGADCVVLG